MVGGLLYIFQKKFLMDSAGKSGKDISNLLAETFNANSKFDIAVNVYVRSVLNKQLMKISPKKCYYSVEPDDVGVVEKVAEKFEISLDIFDLSPGQVRKNDLNPDADLLEVKLFFFPEHYDLAYNIGD